MLLNCHTYYSFCYGTFSTEELLDEIKSKGYTSFVLSDIPGIENILMTLPKPRAGLGGLRCRGACAAGIKPP